MSIELTFNSFNSLSQSDVLGHNQGNPNDIYVKRFSGLATLADGTSVSFDFELTRINAIPVADITDETGSYTVTIEKA